MNISLKDISLANLAKNTSDVTSLALEVYRDALAANRAVADKVSVLVKSIEGYDCKGAKNAVYTKIKSRLPLNTANEINDIKEKPVMKKSQVFGIIAVVAAVAAALTAVAIYLKKKEQNLAEYEEMLYGDDYLTDYMPKEECDCGRDEGGCDEDVVKF